MIVVNVNVTVTVVQNEIQALCEDGDVIFFSTGQPLDLAFACCLGESHSNHLMMVVDNSPGERYAECLEGVETDLEDKHMVWFDGEHSKVSQSEVTVSQTKLDNTGETKKNIPIFLC